MNNLYGIFWSRSVLSCLQIPKIDIHLLDMQMEDKKSCFLRNVSSLWLNQEQISTSSLRKIDLTLKQVFIIHWQVCVLLIINALHYDQFLIKQNLMCSFCICSNCILLEESLEMCTIKQDKHWGRYSLKQYVQHLTLWMYDVLLWLFNTSLGLNLWKDGSRLFWPFQDLIRAKVKL